MSIIVCPLHDVEAIARVRRPSHILSLISPAAEPTGFGKLAPHHLELRFNDITEPREGLVAPSPEHMKAILNFGQSAQAHGSLVVHCWAGVSRSPAAAFVLASDRYKSPPAQLAKRLREAAPYCTPNQRMVAIADELLQSRGTLRNAVSQIGRGHDTTWGYAFEIKGSATRFTSRQN